jgi:hypothetical protein
MTGIGILISGIRPTICGLQAYHWQIIVHVAWFSSITHLSALSFLRHYLVNGRKELYIRGILMAILASLLAVAVSLTGHFDWEEQQNGQYSTDPILPSYFAKCVFKKNMNGESLAFESMVFDLLLIVYGYAIRLLKTWKRASGWPVKASESLRKWSSDRLARWKPARRHRNLMEKVNTAFVGPIVIAVPRVVYLHISIFTSYLAEVASYSYRRRLFFSLGTSS